MEIMINEKFSLRKRIKRYIYYFNCKLFVLFFYNIKGGRLDLSPARVILVQVYSTTNFLVRLPNGV